MDIKKIIAISATVLGASFVVMYVFSKIKKGKYVYDDVPEQKNPMAGKKLIFVEDENDKENADGVKGHLKAVGEAQPNNDLYNKYVKRAIDVVMSFAGLVILSPIYLGISLAIKIDDPGSVLFTQRRIGQNKEYFRIHKFRTMKISTPQDVPTHQLSNPDQYITKVGKFLRAHSLDELPQIWDIFVGNISFIGPRPALWNQDLLTAERDKYGANDVKPGLTGWAQINGRDELEIPVKAKLDGEYVQKQSLLFDAKCFFRTISKVVKDNSVVEGGTGEMKKEEKKRILFLANHYFTLYSFRKELIKRLVEEGHEVYLSLPEDPGNRYFENLGCKIVLTEIDRRGVNPLKDLKLIVYYKKMIPNINPDIIFSYTIKPNIYGTLASNGKYKQVCNITGTGGTFLEDNAISKICKILYRATVKKCYKVYFQNTGDRDFFIKNGMVGNNYEILPGSGCNLEEHAFVEMPQDEITRFIFIGRVMKLKGIDEYLEAAKTVKAKYPNTEFIIAGWNEEEEYKKIVNDYQREGIVNYIGFRTDIGDWIAKCNCTVLTSHGGEGIPNVLLESAATGRVCIGSKINGTMDVIDEGVTGYLFEAGNTNRLVEQIEKFLQLRVEERAAMGKAGREKIEREFDRQIVIQKYCNEVGHSAICA